jgi:hypothetical protein
MSSPASARRRPRALRRPAVAAGGFLLLIVIGGCSLLAADPVPSATASVDPTSAWQTVVPAVSHLDTPSATIPPTPVVSGFQPINMFTVPGPSTHPAFHATDAPFHPSNARPIPSQQLNWLTAKAYGRVALVDGHAVLIDPATNPLLVPGTNDLVPLARTLDLSYTRWIVEPTGRGVDEKGHVYYDKSFWNLCGPGSATIALYYWQQLTGYPNVTGTAGYFLDPYAAEGVPWPSPGPAVPTSGGKRLGTYWSGSDKVSGFTARSRGFLMYMATKAQPPVWSATGIAVWADSSGHGYYPTRGSSLEDIQTGLNWEISGHNPAAWIDSWYGSVNSSDPTLTRDLRAAVMLDVGRDGVPVVAAIDTFDLPNWQKGSATPHTRHAIAIVGYNNTTSPPTYTYLDTCGRLCNPRGGNQNGQIHVTSQATMVAAMTDAVGIGFAW